MRGGAVGYDPQRRYCAATFTGATHAHVRLTPAARSDHRSRSHGDRVRRPVVFLPRACQALWLGTVANVPVTEDDLAGLFYTGGTTGKSKGVMLTHRNLVANSQHWMLSAPQRPDDTFLIIAPLFHAAGSNGVLASIWTLGSQIAHGTFDPAVALDLIEEHGVTVTLGVPTMLAAMAELQHTQPRTIDSVRLIAHGGSPIATEVVRRTSSAFPGAELMEVYGATELSPLCTVLPNEQTLLDSPLARSCGRPVIGCEISICDPQGEPLPPGDIGEVVVNGPNVMRGYWNKAEQTEAVLKPGGYWTGDLG